MRAIQVSSTLSRAFAVAVSMAVLASCAQDTTPSTPDPPADALTALVYGMTSSPIYEALKTKLTMTPWDGGQEAGDFDLVILDGDAFTAQQLKEEEELIHSAIRGGVWILGLDLTEDHKGDGLGHLLGAGTSEKSHAYLTRLTRSPNGHPSSTYIDFRDEQADAALQAQRIVEYVEGKGIGAQQNNDQEPADPPKGALMWEHDVTQGLNIVLPRNNNPDHRGQPIQTASWTQSYTIRLYLANAEDPLQGEQWVAIEQRGEANPNQLAIYHNKCDPNCPYAGAPASMTPSYEIAWLQTQFAPAAAIGGNLFALHSTSPQNVNQQSTVQTSSTFSIGVNVQAGPEGPQGGISAGYSYSTTTTKVISDWKVSNDSNPGATNPEASWRFGSANPFDGFNTQSGYGDLYNYNDPCCPQVPDPSAFVEGGFGYNTVRDPNELSLKNFGYATSSVWQSDGVSTDTIFIGGTDNAWHTDAYYRYVPEDDVDNYYLARYNNQHQWGLNVNLGAVVPVAISSLGIIAENPADNNTVTAGQNAAGTVTLAAPANADATIYLTLLSQYATIPTPSIIIPKGSKTGTFELQTSNDGSCHHFGAQIEAFYATGRRQEINIIQPVPPEPSCQK